MTLPTIIRWTPSRKRSLLNDIREGRVTRETALAQYKLSHEELAEWERVERRFGEAGLRTTKTDVYRKPA